jgi:hypothetical protein
VECASRDHRISRTQQAILRESWTWTWREPKINKLVSKRKLFSLSKFPSSFVGALRLGKERSTKLTLLFCFELWMWYLWIFLLSLT